MVLGDWSDVHAAALTATEPMELAIIERREPGMGVIEFSLLSVRSESGVLIAELVEPTELMGDGRAEGEGVQIRLRARIGLFGDPQRERELIDRAASRLAELAGRGTAPIGG